MLTITVKGCLLVSIPTFSLNKLCDEKCGVCLLRFRRTMDRIISFCLIFHYLDLLPLILRRLHRTALFLFSYPLSPHIFDHPLRYLVADPLSSYQCCGVYLVRYIEPQSSVTVHLDYVPSSQ